jgi:hypothetical protein
VSESGSLSVAVALLADMLRARDHIDRNYPSTSMDLRGWRACRDGRTPVRREPREFTAENFK